MCRATDDEDDDDDNNNNDVAEEADNDDDGGDERVESVSRRAMALEMGGEARREEGEVRERDVERR